MPCDWIFMRQNSRPEAELPHYRGEVVQIYDELKGPGEMNTDIFLRYHMTDKSKEEVKEYLSRWNRDIVFEIVNGPDPETGFRRIKCSNEKINETINIGGWTQEQADNIVNDWNERYPEAQLEEVGFTPKDLLVQGFFTSGQAAEFQLLVRETGEDYNDRHAIWKLRESACQAFEATGGVKEGTAQQLGPSLVYGPDALEDD